MSAIYLVCAIILALVVPAKSQGITDNWPKTVRIVDNATGELIGTHTITGNVIYIRDKNGELTMSVTINPDGSRTSRDPSGKMLDQNP
jgi:hypothetical protein